MELLMSFSIQRETSDGTLSTLDLTIEYIDRTDVRAYVNDIEIDLTGGSTPYTWEWVTDSQIKITPVVPNGLVAMVKRSTPMDAMYHVYDAGAIFKDETVDENFKQVLFLNQEAKEGSGVSDIYSDVNIHGYVIRNHGAAVLDGDLVTFGQYRNDSLGANFNRVAAEAARDVAVAAKDLAVTSANNAAASETAANLSATNASTSESNAEADRILAQDAANTAVSAYDSFDDRYLGSKATDPTLDNDGTALLEGALYWNSTVKEMRVYNGATWVVAYLPADGYLEKNQNLADLQDLNTALANLSLDAVDNTADADKPVSTPQRDFMYARAGSAGSTSSRNKIINGKMEINQRGVSGTVTLAAGAYGHDRWKAGASGCTYTFATSNNVITLTISAGSLQQVIEGNNLQTGTYTLSWTGTAQGKIGAGSYSAAGVTGSIVGGTNTTVEFNTGTVSLVQLEFGSTASAFEHRFLGQEMALCQRYYEVLNVQMGAYCVGGDLLRASGTYRVAKRATPTLNWLVLEQSNASSIMIDQPPLYSGPDSVRLLVFASSLGMTFANVKLFADAEL